MSFNKEGREHIKTEIIEAIGESELKKEFKPQVFAKKHNVSVTTIYRYLKQLEKENCVNVGRDGRKNEYSLIDEVEVFKFELSEISEDKVWREYIQPLLKNMPETAFKNCNYAFTEMLNNAIEHSGGTNVEIIIKNNSFRAVIAISDNGVGIFSKIAEAMKLEEKRFAVLELAKGKFTTDPESHTGEGIFFSSKATDAFAILSDNLVFIPLNRTSSSIDSVLEDYRGPYSQKGTFVLFKVLYNHKQTLKELFDKYTAEPDHYGFTKTIVPVKLLEYGDDAALYTSRSQAKRLIVRFEKFNYIELDFTGIDEIGQGFADEIFRVFSNQHPEISLIPTHCSTQVQNMINRAKNSR
jgi:anti-sigma regulatory factor (Ser/Thr protein kinase)